MRRPPAFARALLRALLPRHEISEALEGDLAGEFARRAADSLPGARWWYCWQVLTLPYVRLHREVGRLRGGADRRMGTGGGWMGGSTMDLRIAARSLARRPVFAGVAIATLALSIGAATLLFSVVDGVLLRPLPYERPENLVTVYLKVDAWRNHEIFGNTWDSWTLTLDHVRAFREASGPVAAVAGYTYRRLPLHSGDGLDDVEEAIQVDEGLFDVLGVPPAIGRLPTPDEIHQSTSVAVLRHDTWQRRFGGDPEILGRAFEFGDRTYTVIGVMPPGFFFPTEDGGDLWVPVMEEAREWPSFYGLARVEPGTDVSDVSAFLDRTARRLGEEDPDKASHGARALPHLDNIVGSVKGGIHLLFGTALLVVFVACVNLANLFLARAAGRREELAVRASLGASAGSLMTVMLGEALVIGLAGAGLGIALAAGAIDPFVEALSTSMRGLPRQASVALDARILTLSVAATLATVVLASLGPTSAAALRAPAQAIGNSRWSGAGDGTRRGQRLLLSMQAALTVVLVSAAALLGRSFLQALAVDMGMATERLAVLDVDVEVDAGTEAEVARAATASAQERVRQRVRRLPGVTAAAVATTLPSTGGVLLPRLRAADEPPENSQSVSSVTVGPGYFEAVGIELIAGREFRSDPPTDALEEGVVSQSLAVRLFGHTDVVGRRLMREADGGDREVEIVGVVADARQLSTFMDPSPTYYRPITRSRTDHFYLVMAVDGDPGSVLAPARDAILELDPRLEVDEASTLRAMLLHGMRHIRLRMVLMASLAGLALLLAMIGISGVVAHYLSEQTRDVGIRMALGAAARREVGRVVRHALTPTVLGLLVGVGIAVASSRVMESFVFEVEPTDPVTYAAVGLLLLGTAALAAWIPARRTAAVDPARVLNREG